MTGSSGDAWLAGAAYDAYMGRWSRRLAEEFVTALCPTPSAHWLEVGCGTGALTSAICALGAPASVVACDPAEPLLGQARQNAAQRQVSFVVAGAGDLPRREGGFDLIVSGLVLNFIPDPESAVRAMRARLAPEGVAAAYVWDYADGAEFLRCFWEEAAALDPGAARFDERHRFPLCEPAALETLFAAAGLERVETGQLQIETRFADFDDYWRPFLGGTGPAPSYVASLAEPLRDALRERLRQRLLGANAGPVSLMARAFTVRGVCN